MTDLAPAVALLFGDTELGVQLREALTARGAHIVHEGFLSTLSRNLLEQVGADVLVVNLDDSADDALDHLYEVIDGDLPRVVFNDAQASRALTGWDRARWARHLAVKVMAAGDIDPPRPDGARGLDIAVAAGARETLPADMPVFVDGPKMATDGFRSEETEAVAAAGEVTSELASDPNFEVHEENEVEREQNASAKSESLAAELEAMLAYGNLLEEDEEPDPGLPYFDDDVLSPLHLGNLSDPSTAREQPVPWVEEADSADFSSLEMTDAPFEHLPSMMPTAEFRTDHLQLSSLTDPSVTISPAAAAEPVIGDAPAAMQAPANWALLDGDAEPASAPESRETPEPEDFGVQKLSAADFLAPDVESTADDNAETTMSLELVSIEEAIAPQAYVHESEHEMILDELGSALSRIVLLGAAISGLDSVCAFLAALPATTRLTFLLTQHLGDNLDTALVERFATHCALPVRLASAGSNAAAGEVLLVPAGQQVSLRRDGKIELQAIGSNAVLDPSIDVSLTMAASAFGRDALAIVFAGRGNDAVAGAQAIHDRGGQVWVESSSGEYFADMVSGIFAERLVSFSGTSPELAAHLIEVFP